MMKTKQQLADEIKALQDEYDAMPEVGINYKPKYGEYYFIIFPTGEVISSVWNDDLQDNAHYARGNCYPTEEAAERIDRNRMTLVKLREFAFVPDFEDKKQAKYIFSVADDLADDELSDNEYGIPVCFKSFDDRTKARNIVGAEAIKDMLQGGLV